MGCCCRNKSQKCKLGTTGLIGVLLVVIGSVIMVIYYAVFYSQVKKQTTIKPGTAFYKEWKDTTQSLFIKFYMFNVTNRDEFVTQEPGEFVKPVLQEVGPYTYRIYLSKDKIDFLDNTPQEVAYRQKMFFEFQPDQSRGSEDDTITTINFIALAIPPVLDYLLSQPGATNITALQKQLLYKILDNIIEDTESDLIFTHTAGGLLFGFQDPLLTAVVDVLNDVLVQVGLEHLGPLSDTFGIFRALNSSDGWKNYHAYTGNPEYWLTNLISRLDNETSLNYWYGDTCNMINGTDETTRPPLLPKEEKIYFFVPSFCRSTYAVYNREVKIREIPAWEYVVPPEVFAAPGNSEYNKCFCDEKDTEEYCVHDGGFVLRNCLYGAPVMLSAPHFLHGDGYWRNHVVGLEPNTSKHATVFAYEPNSGVCLQGHKYAQFNLYLRPYQNLKIAHRIEEVFSFPIFWVDGTYTVDDRFSKLLYGLIVISYAVVLAVQIAVIVAGALLCVYTLYKLYQLRMRGYQASFHEKTTSTKDEISIYSLEKREKF